MTPSWAVLDTSWGHLSRLGGHLGRLGGILEAILGHLGRLGHHLGPSWGNKGSDGRIFGIFRVAGGTGRSPRGSSFGKEPKPKPRGFGTPGTPVMNQQGAADLVASGPSRHRAWVVGLCPQRCFFGVFSERFGKLLEAFGSVLGTVGGFFGPCGSSWRPRA